MILPQFVVFEVTYVLQSLYAMEPHLRALAARPRLGVTLANRYDAIATFDQKLLKRAKDAGVPSFW